MRGSRTKVNCHVKDLGRVFTATTLAHEEYLDHLDPQDEDYSDDWIEDLGFTVDTCKALAEEYIQERALDTPSEKADTSAASYAVSTSSIEDFETENLEAKGMNLHQYSFEYLPSNSSFQFFHQLNSEVTSASQHPDSHAVSLPLKSSASQDSASHAVGGHMLLKISDPDSRAVSLPLKSSASQDPASHAVGGHMLLKISDPDSRAVSLPLMSSASQDPASHAVGGHMLLKISDPDSHAVSLPLMRSSSTGKMQFKKVSVFFSTWQKVSFSSTNL